MLSISRRRGKPPLQVRLRYDDDTDVSKYRIKSRISAPSPPNAIVGHIPIIGAAQISFDPFWASSWRLERPSLSASIDAVDVAKKLRVEGEGGMPSRGHGDIGMWPRRTTDGRHLPRHRRFASKLASWGGAGTSESLPGTTT